MTGLCRVHELGRIIYSPAMRSQRLGVLSHSFEVVKAIAFRQAHCISRRKVSGPIGSRAYLGRGSIGRDSRAFLFHDRSVRVGCCGQRAASHSVAFRQGGSMVPIIGGLCGALGFAISENGVISSYWWMPLILDVGAGPLLAWTAAWALTSRIRLRAP